MTANQTGIRYPFEAAPEQGAALEIAPGVLWIRLPLPMALDHVNVFALDEGDSWTIVDTGFNSRKTQAIWQTVLDGPLAGKPVSRVVVTHYHPDHVGMAGWFVQRGAELVTTRTSWLYARMLTLDDQDSYTPEALQFYQRSGMRADLLEKRKSERPFNFADCVAPIPIGFTRLKEGDTVTMGGRVWDVRMGDGHAAEHATFWSRDCNLVIGGDQLLPSISPNIGVYPTEPEADPLTDWFNACARLAPFARPDHFVLGGHKLPYTGLPMRMTQLIDNHHGALARLSEHLSEPRTGGECFIPLFKREINGPEYGMALVEAVAHLNHLHQAGKARRWLADDGAYRWQMI